MKKIVSLILTLAVVLFAMPLGALTVSAETEYTTTLNTSTLYYSIENGEATITDCDTSISGDVILPSTLGGYPVTSIGDHAFSNCTSLASLTIGNGVIIIGMDAFSYCSSLTSVNIPHSVEFIDIGSFWGCYSLTNIIVDSNNSSFSSLNGVLFDKNKTSLICYPAGKKASYTIPNSVTNIGYGAFIYCSLLTFVTIPDSVTYIDYFAFYGCDSLTSVTIPDSVTTISYEAFYNCTSLVDVYYGGTEEEWGIINIESGNEYLLNANIIYPCKFVALLNLPDKLKYHFGEELDLTGGEIVVGHSDGTFEFKPITAEMVSGFDNAPGLKILTISYAGKKTELPVFMFRNPDLDGNGTVSATDVAVLKKSLLSSNKPTEDHDLNVDGACDILDLVHIKKVVAN